MKKNWGIVRLRIRASSVSPVINPPEFWGVLPVTNKKGMLLITKTGHIILIRESTNLTKCEGTRKGRGPAKIIYPIVELDWLGLACLWVTSH